MWPWDGSEMTVLVLAVSAAGSAVRWALRHFTIESVKPIKIGPLLIRLRSEQSLADRSTFVGSQQMPVPSSSQDSKTSPDDGD
jgi:hypothetical protein